MTVLHATAAEDFAWIQAHAYWPLTPYARALKAVDAGGIRGMVAFDDWTPNSVQLHIAAETPLAWRRLAPAASDLVFNRAGKGVALGIIPAGNAAAVALAEASGFTARHRILDGWAEGEDLIVFEMRKSECRWLQSEATHGR